jgi:hypothetical protein
MIDPVLFRELPVIQKIIEDETWLESERRRCCVSSEDPVVQENVCQIILRIGAALRDALTREMVDAPQQIPINDHSPHAA